MDPEPDKLFLRWRDRRDTDALARVFDLAAPRLLRLALHLVGDAGAAEDLVQATFVTAMERASTFDSSRSLDPWLAGILANHARDLKRDARRVDTSADIEAQLDLDEQTPLTSALAAEESAALAKAVDALPEPYRAVMLLRLRHGMKDADIAHVLDRSPGAVRVQLHRGREMLRNNLPASLVGAVMLLAAPARGMAALKASVLTHAAAIQSVSTSTALIGGAIVTKKVLVGAAFVLLIAALVGWRMMGEEPSRGADVARIGVEKKLDKKLDEVESKAELAPATVPSVSPRADASSVASTVELTSLPGRVVDVATGKGIAGAQIELFATHRMSYAELQRAAGQRGGPDGDYVHNSTWPTVLDALSDLQRAGREDLDVYDEPVPGQIAIATAVTNADGGFELVCPKLMGFLVCRADGFETRRMPAKPYQDHWKNNEHGQAVPTKIPLASLTIGMFLPKRFYGHLVDEEGNRVARRMQLAVHGNWLLPGQENKHGPLDVQSIDTWPIRTGEDGSFDCMIAASDVYVRSQESGVELTNVGMHPVHKQRWVFESSWHPGEQTEPAMLIVKSRPAPCLVVRERESHAPVEHFDLLGKGIPQGVRAWSGLQFAPKGRLALTDGSDTMGDYMKSGLQKPYAFTVWASGFAPAMVKVANLLEAGDILVELERGSVPSVRGLVHEGAKRIAGACVTLVPTPDGQFSTEWHDVTDAVLTDDRGTFELHGPAGKFALRVVHGETIEWRAIVIPDNRDVDIDLGIDTQIVARVRHPDGTPCPNHVIACQSADGANLRAKSDENGVATFSRLSGGKYQLLVPYVSTENSFSADEVIRVELVRGERRDVDVTIPLKQSRFARLVVEGTTTIGGWKAMNPHEEEPWVTVEPDGRIPIDIQFGVHEITLQGPDARSWNAHLPKNPPDGYEIRIAPEGPGYEGVLTSLADGKGIPRVRVNAYVPGREGEGFAVPACVTDAEGRFSLRGLTADKWLLWFDDGDNRRGIMGKLAGLNYTPDKVPGSPAVALAIALPRKSGAVWEGMSTTVLRGKIRGGAAGRNLSVVATARAPVSGGELTAFDWGRAGEDGSFELTVMVAPHYRVVVTDMGVQENVGTFDWDEVAAGAVIERGFDVK